MRIVITGATGGIGGRVAADLGRENNIVAVRHLLEHDENADAIICCHAAPIEGGLASLLTTDVVGAMSSVGYVLRSMKDRNAGRIILLSSIRAHRPRPSQAIYATTKAAIEGLTRGLAVEYGPMGITANCIAPGALPDTPRTAENIRLGRVSLEELQAQTPGRMATVETVIGCVRWLLSDEASAVNGQVITLDGGWSVKG